MSSQSLDSYYLEVKEIILSKQHPITGLLPASTAITIHGNYTDAWVRDNVYSILSVWGLAIAYRKAETRPSRTFELQQATINLMQGLMRAMMQQARKVETFKSTLALHDALHAKYDTATGQTVVGDHEWGHLQIDATSLFLLMLAQMIESGLPIITNQTEVDFVQNLVYYIERAYRTPDYGIWERGEKSNVGYVELNASSLGMAKAALEALDNFKLIPAAVDDISSIIQVLPDNVALASVTLHAMLPRESSTKEVDSALLSVIGYPAFAVNDSETVEMVRIKIREVLGGNYGYKRFLRDGHQTSIEDANRHYYEPEELRQFENIESEWPLFFTYEYLDALFRKDSKEVQHFRKQIDRIVTDHNDQKLLPELYYVPEDLISAEKAVPNSQVRVPNENIPLTWAQSLFILGKLIHDNHLSTIDIDPLGRYKTVKTKPNFPIQILVLSEDQSVKELLMEQGISSQTPPELGSVAVKLPKEIAGAYSMVGANEKLSLTGRPSRRMRTLTTSRLFRINNQEVVCLSLFFLQREFYLAYDIHFLVERFKSELKYLQSNWRQTEWPIVTILLTHQHLNQESKELLNLLMELNAGSIEGIQVRLGPLAELQKETSCVDLSKIKSPDGDLPQTNIYEGAPILNVGIDHRPLGQMKEIVLENETDQEALIQVLQDSENLFEQIEVLTNLVNQYGLNHQVRINHNIHSLSDLLEDVYYQAGKLKVWSILRQASALLVKVDLQLQASVNQILVNQKLIQVGKAYTDESLIIKPIPFSQLLDIIHNYCREDLRDQVLTQEILVYLGILIKSDPDLFADLLTIRVSYLTLLLTGATARARNLSQEDAFDWLMHQPPSYIQKSIKSVLEKYRSMGALLENLESIDNIFTGTELSWTVDLDFQSIEDPNDGWMIWRQSMGTINRVPDDFYKRIWRILEHATGIIIGDKLDRRNRLTSTLMLSDMTSGEKAFALRVESLLNKINAPEYRQLTIEALLVVSSFTEQNPELKIEDHIVFDIITGHAVRIAFLDYHPALRDTYHDHKPEAWAFFYELSPLQSAKFISESFKYLLEFKGEDAELIPELIS